MTSSEERKYCWLSAGGTMTIRRIFLAGIVVGALGSVSSLSAFPAQDATTTVTKKAKKSTKAAADTAATAESTTAGSAKKAATAPAKTASESEIAAAKASGKVWVNTETGVYHKGGKWYGATKQGKFMTENEAIKAGYRASKGQ